MISSLLLFFLSPKLQKGHFLRMRNSNSYSSQKQEGRSYQEEESSALATVVDHDLGLHVLVVPDLVVRIVAGQVHPEHFALLQTLQLSLVQHHWQVVFLCQLDLAGFVHLLEEQAVILLVHCLVQWLVAVLVPTIVLELLFHLGVLAAFFLGVDELQHLGMREGGVDLEFDEGQVLEGGEGVDEGVLAGETGVLGRVHRGGLQDLVRVQTPVTHREQVLGVAERLALYQQMLHLHFFVQLRRHTQLLQLLVAETTRFECLHLVRHFSQGVEDVYFVQTGQRLHLGLVEHVGQEAGGVEHLGGLDLSIDGTERGFQELVHHVERIVHFGDHAMVMEGRLVVLGETLESQVPVEVTGLEEAELVDSIAGHLTQNLLRDVRSVDLPVDLEGVFEPVVLAQVLGIGQSEHVHETLVLLGQDESLLPFLQLDVQFHERLVVSQFQVGFFSIAMVLLLPEAGRALFDQVGVVTLVQLTTHLDQRLQGLLLGVDLDHPLVIFDAQQLFTALLPVSDLEQVVRLVSHQNRHLSTLRPLFDLPVDTGHGGETALPLRLGSILQRLFRLLVRHHHEFLGVIPPFQLCEQFHGLVSHVVLRKNLACLAEVLLVSLQLGLEVVQLQLPLFVLLFVLVGQVQVVEVLYFEETLLSDVEVRVAQGLHSQKVEVLFRYSHAGQLVGRLELFRFDVLQQVARLGHIHRDQFLSGIQQEQLVPLEPQHRPPELLEGGGEVSAFHEEHALSRIADQVFEVQVEGHTVYIHLCEDLLFLQQVPDSEVVVGVDQSEHGLTLVGGHAADRDIMFHEHDGKGVIDDDSVYLAIGETDQQVFSAEGASRQLGHRDLRVEHPLSLHVTLEVQHDQFVPLTVQQCLSTQNDALALQSLRELLKQLVLQLLRTLLVDDHLFLEVHGQEVLVDADMLDQLATLDSDLAVLVQLLDQNVSDIHPTDVLVLEEGVDQVTLHLQHPDSPGVASLHHEQLISIRLRPFQLHVPDVLLAFRDHLDEMQVSGVHLHLVVTLGYQEEFPGRHPAQGHRLVVQELVSQQLPLSRVERHLLLPGADGQHVVRVFRTDWRPLHAPNHGRVAQLLSLDHFHSLVPERQLSIHLAHCKHLAVGGVVATQDLGVAGELLGT